MVDSSWWKRVLPSKRGLTVITFSVVLVCIAFAIGIGVIVSNRKSCDTEIAALFERESLKYTTNIRDTCYTVTCQHAASEIHRNMDTSVDPCHNFYKFACGNFLKRTTIPDHKSRINVFSRIRNELQIQLRKSIEGTFFSDNRKSTKLVKNLYESCMNTRTIEKRGVEPLLTILKKLGGWPVLEGGNWNEIGFHWIKSVHKFRDMGLPTNYFIGFKIAADLQDSSKQIIYIEQPSFGNLYEYLVGGQGEEIVKAYHEYMIEVAVLLGAPMKVAEEELAKSLEFERALARISPSRKRNRAITRQYRPMNIDRLSKQYPSIPWKMYLNRLIGPKTWVGDYEKIIVQAPKYLSDFPKVMRSVSRRVQANYMMWRVVAASVRYLTEDLRRIQSKFEMKMSGKPTRESRWKECTHIVSRRLPLSLSSLYIKKYFNENAKKYVITMFRDIKYELNLVLRRVIWMDRYTRRNALRKASAMLSHIAYPNELLYNKKVDEFYRDLELTGESYLNNALNLSRFSAEYSIDKLAKPFDKSDWKNHGNAVMLNAFYKASENSIQIPAAILQGSLFNQHRPKYMNFGGIGFIIGHEITHGFDGNGRYFNEHGNTVTWWTQSATRRYNHRAQCITNQYGNYIVSEVGLRLNGMKTRDENIADNGGTKLAYLAYRRWASKYKKEQQLPGLNYSPQQMFWISSASARCSKYRPELLKYMIFNQRHSPAEFRVIGPFSNMIEFARDFKCRWRTKMNPIKKCVLW